MTEVDAEEAWESEIGAMLGALPDVDPPQGFIAAALDHRPLWAMRTLSTLCFAVVFAVGASLVLGVGAGRIIPQVDDLSERHLAAAAGHGGASEAAGRDTDDTGGTADGTTPSSGEIDAASVSLAAQGFEQEAMIASADLRQAVYARDDRVVSVFEAAGELDWDRLPDSGRTVLGDTEAWVDEERAITIIETRDGIVTIVGLSPEEVRDLIVGLPTESPSLAGRAEELATAIARQLGFPG